MLPLLLGVSAVVLWLIVRHRCSALRKSKDSALPLPPGDFGWLPFLGNTIQFIRDDTFITGRSARLGPVFKAHVLGEPTVFVTGAAEVRKVLLSEHKDVEATWPQSARMLLGDSLATQSGDVHRLHKRFLLQAYTPHAVAECVEGLTTRVARTVASWAARPAADGPMLVYPAMKRLTFSVLWGDVLGLNADDPRMDDMCVHLQTLSDNLFTLPVSLPGTPLAKALAARRALLEVVHEVIAAKRGGEAGAAPATGGRSVMDIVMTLPAVEGDLHNRTDMLGDQLILQMFAGHDTSSCTLTALLDYLGGRPALVDRLYEEQAEVCEKVGPELTPTALSAAHMPLLDACIKETLRVKPAAAGGFRKATRTFELGGFQIPKGWKLVYGIRAVHESHPAYTNPQAFDPDRFLPPREELSPESSRWAFLPFGGGARVCLGQHLAMLEMRAVVATVARLCTLEPRGPANYRMFPMPVPRSGLPMRFVPRPSPLPTPAH